MSHNSVQLDTLWYMKKTRPHNRAHRYDGQWRTQEFCSEGGGSKNSVEDREKGDLGAVTP